MTSPRVHDLLCTLVLVIPTGELEVLIRRLLHGPITVVTSACTPTCLIAVLLRRLQSQLVYGFPFALGRPKPAKLDAKLSKRLLSMNKCTTAFSVLASASTLPLPNLSGLHLGQLGVPTLLLFLLAFPFSTLENNPRSSIEHPAKL